MKIIDISQPLFQSKVFDGDTAPVRTLRRDYKDGYRLTDITMCLHNGTHIDAPSHYIEGGANADGIELNKCIGRCYLLRCDKDIDADVIDALPQGITRLLLDGKGLITHSGAQQIVARNIQLVGIGRISVANPDNCTDVHTILLSNGIVIIEGLSMREVKQGYYKLIALPLKLEGCEASPVRAVLVDAFE